VRDNQGMTRTDRRDDDERFDVHLGKPPSQMSDEELFALASDLAAQMELAEEPVDDEPGDDVA
jgi:hypothetical protein